MTKGKGGSKAQAAGASRVQAVALGLRSPAGT